MPEFTFLRSGRSRTPVVLLTSALGSFASVRRAAALALTELAIGAFVVVSIGDARGGLAALLPVIGVLLVAAYVRRTEVASWALLVPGGFLGRVERALGRAAVHPCAALALVERLALAALIGALVADNAVVVAASALGGWDAAGDAASRDAAVALGVALVGAQWMRLRLGFVWSPTTMARAVWTGVALLGVVGAWALASALATGGVARLFARTALPPGVEAEPLAIAAAVVAALGLALPAVGGSEALTRLAHEFPAPRLAALRRTHVVVMLVVTLLLLSLTVAFAALVAAPARTAWANVPLVALAQALPAPAWLRAAATVLVPVCAALLLLPALQTTVIDAAQLARRLARSGAFPESWAAADPRLGTPTRSLDLAATVVTLVIVASAGRIDWLAAVYAVSVATLIVVRSAVLARLQGMLPGPELIDTPGTVRMGRRAWPIGPLVLALLVGGIGVALAARGGPGLAAALCALGLILIVARRRSGEESSPEGAVVELLASADIAVEDATARPGNLLVAVRHPHALEHVALALRSDPDREIVVMTVRLHGIDTDAESVANPEPLPAERYLFAQVMTLVERYARPVRLLVVPAPTVAEGMAAALARLRSSAIYAGESATLSAADQARLLGEAWERIDHDSDLDVRLVIHHRSGRVDTYQLGAHPPSLTAADIELIHRLWRDATRAIGPHVHHHDIVRAALTHMEQQLNGPDREAALDRIRETVRPAEELAAVIRARDFTRLRDIVRNRPPHDVAEVLTALHLEDQVVAFRVLPRKDAAAVFEYLSHESQETLLKALAQEDVSALLNDMAPDDRTMFLEELPAAVTRQLLALLSPDERAVAARLLGYPEGSVGRLMTPDYVAVREEWTVSQVLDYVRTHGQDSETLNIIYVVDDRHALVDDVRIREILLTDPGRRVSELMDRRFVALKATDDQATAVAAFRQHDRVALPVTDTAGMLIGIVTIDDVLDVAEAAATREIQKIGGSEALDEPYMQIAFGRMIRKRAGWLTALFLGEMLTATAMVAFAEEISKAVVLAFFVPLIISSGGNSGSQASTLVIRALALGEVGLRDWWRVIRREVFAGLALGGILGSIGFLRVTLWSGFSDMYGPHWLLVALTVALALLGIVLWGTVIGSLLPFLLRRLGFDPATSSAPFVATLVDVTGLVIYFSVAMIILRGTLL